MSDKSVKSSHFSSILNECKQDFEYIRLQKVFDPFMYNPQAQSDNMELMDACLEKNVRLIDYERMCDESGKFIL